MPIVIGPPPGVSTAGSQTTLDYVPQVDDQDVNLTPTSGSVDRLRLFDVPPVDGTFGADPVVDTTSVSRISDLTWRFTFDQPRDGRYYALVDWTQTPGSDSVQDHCGEVVYGCLIVSVAEAVDHLRGRGTFTQAEQERLSGYCRAVHGLIELKIGPVRPRLVERVFRSWPIFLPQPIIEVRGVEEDNGSGTVLTLTERTFGTAPTALQYEWDPVTESLTRTSWCYAWESLVRIRVTYLAGRDEVPAEAREAALTQIQRWWENSQGGGHPGVDDNGFGRPAVSTGLDADVVDMLAPLLLGPRNA